MIKQAYIGKWRITEMDQWDKEYIDLVAPGQIEIKKNGTGVLRFGAMEAEIDARVEKTGERERLAFSFYGWDEGDDVSGRGWMEVDNKDMTGWLSFHLGDDSSFKGKKK